jgi:hypothetical protein
LLSQKKDKETPKPPKTKEELKAEERLKEYQKVFRSTDSAAFTSSVYEPTKAKLNEYVPKKTKKKGFVSLVTNKGSINLMLHCDLVIEQQKVSTKYSNDEHFEVNSNALLKFHSLRSLERVKIFSLCARVVTTITQNFIG